MAPPSSQITPPPIPFPHHRRADSTIPYVPSSDLLSQGTTFIGRENQWDLPYFPLWNTRSSYVCPNNCLWGNAESVDNYVDCQNDKSCVCEPETLSTAVVWAGKCVEKKCVGEARPGDGVGYVQTLLVEFCENAWREEGRTVKGGFEIPKSVEGGVDVRGTTWTGTATGTGDANGQSQETTSADSTPSPTSDESSDSSSDSNSSNNNIGLKAGLGAGIPLFILFLTAFLLFYLRKRRFRKSQLNVAPQEVMGDIPPPPPPAPATIDHYASGEWHKYYGHHDQNQQQQQQQLWVPPVEIGGRRSVVVDTPPPEQVEVKLEEERRISAAVGGDGGDGDGRRGGNRRDDWSTMRTIPS